MRAGNVVLCSLLSILLASCAAPLTPEQKSAFEASAAREIKCREGHDCADKWQKAVEWVNANSAAKAQNPSGDLIQTASIPGDSHWAYKVTRESQGKRKYVIRMTQSCDNAFGCEPSELAVRAGFADALLGQIVPKESAEEKPVSTYGSIEKLMPQIEAVIGKCEEGRKRGVIKDFRESVECSDPRMLRIFRNAGYPYMDLAHGFATKRMKFAKQVDSKQMTADDMEAKVKAEVAAIEKKEAQRNAPTAPAVSQTPVPAPESPAEVPHDEASPVAADSSDLPIAVGASRPSSPVRH